MTFCPTTLSLLNTQNASYANNPTSAVAHDLKDPNPMTLRKSDTMKHATALFSVKL